MISWTERLSSVQVRALKCLWLRVGLEFASDL